MTKKSKYFFNYIETSPTTNKKTLTINTFTQNPKPEMQWKIK